MTPLARLQAQAHYWHWQCATIEGEIARLQQELRDTRAREAQKVAECVAASKEEPHANG